MNQINFTKEHESRLKDLLWEMVTKDVIFVGSVTPYTAYEIFNALSLNSLETLYNRLDKELQKFDKVSRWLSNNEDSVLKESTQMKKEFVDLVIGYKMYQQQLSEKQEKIEKLQSEIEKLKESQKSPEDLIKEKEASLKELTEE